MGHSNSATFQSEVTAIRCTAIPGGAPALSIILATDTYDRVEVAIESWRKQTIAGRCELVLITTSADAMRVHTDGMSGFHGIQVVETPSIDTLSRARGIGVRSATGQSVFVAETHAYLIPCSRKRS